MIYCDPNETVEVTLNRDAKRQKTFIFRVLSCREQAEWTRLLKEAHALNVMADQVPIVVRALSIGMVGWRNVKDRDTGELVPFERTKDDGGYIVRRLDDVLTRFALWELAFEAMKAIQLKDSDLGKSDSPPDTDATSASDAPPPASAANGAPTETPSTSPATSAGAPANATA